MKKSVWQPIALAAALLFFAAGYLVAQRPIADTVQILTSTNRDVPPAEEAARGLIDVNTAQALELADLPGIGPVLAERIVAYRAENGPFAVPEDLLDVSGIGPKKLEGIGAYITLSP